jgi:hypothetical protein
MSGAQDSMVLTLRKPVSLGDQTYAELDLCEPTVEQLLKSSRAGAGIDQAVELIHLNAKVPKAVVLKLSHRDFNEAVDFLGRFGETSPPTGGM